MAKVVVLGAGLGGTLMAYEMKAELGANDSIAVIGQGPRYHFVPSNPWVAVGWRDREEVEIDIGAVMARRGIGYHEQGAARVHPAENRVELTDGNSVDYDYLVLATGPELAFDEIPGLGPQGFTQSICHVDHAEKAFEALEQFAANPGPIVVGAVQGASCFGPAYEFAFILDTELRKRRIRDKVPMTFVTSEPYIGHLGLDGVGDTKSLMESELRDRHIKFITNARVHHVESDKMVVEEVGEDGAVKKTAELPFKYAMMLPAFRGVPAVKGIEGLTNPRGFVIVDKKQRNPKYPNVFGIGVGIAIAAGGADPGSGGRAQDRVHDRIHGDRHRQEHRRPDARQGSRHRGHLERGLPGGFRRWRRRLCGRTANPAPQRQLGVRRQMGALRQDRLREIFPAQDPQGRKRTLL